jgi:uncharacterized protein
MESALSTVFSHGVNLDGVKLSTHIHPAGFPPLTGEVLTGIVQRIISNPQVKKIILFGSYASKFATPTPDSDIDLLVIMDTSALPAERILAVSRLLRPRPFPMDILVRTPQEIRSLLECGDDFFQEIITYGKVLYER